MVDLPKFNGDELNPDHTGGDLSIQACADDPQVALHAVRQLVRLAYGSAALRWTQAGFAPSRGENTPRNLMGFKDGTQQPKDLDAAVWVGEEGPDWMQGGSYLVVRKIRIALEHWDRTPVDFQEQTIGRQKYSGSPLGGKAEFDPLDLAALDSTGKPAILQNAHVRMAAAATNDGAQILRRAFSYNDGTNFTAERTEFPPVATLGSGNYLIENDQNNHNNLPLSTQIERKPLWRRSIGGCRDAILARNRPAAYSCFATLLCRHAAKPQSAPLAPASLKQHLGVFAGGSTECQSQRRP